jgi:hypothetical protein
VAWKKTSEMIVGDVTLDHGVLGVESIMDWVIVMMSYNDTCIVH